MESIRLNIYHLASGIWELAFLHDLHPAIFVARNCKRISQSLIKQLFGIIIGQRPTSLPLCPQKHPGMKEMGYISKKREILMGLPFIIVLFSDNSVPVP